MKEARGSPSAHTPKVKHALNPHRPSQRRGLRTNGAYHRTPRLYFLPPFFAAFFFGAAFLAAFLPSRGLCLACSLQVPALPNLKEGQAGVYRAPQGARRQETKDCRTPRALKNRQRLPARFLAAMVQTCALRLKRTELRERAAGHTALKPGSTTTTDKSHIGAADRRRGRALDTT